MGNDRRPIAVVEVQNSLVEVATRGKEFHCHTAHTNSGRCCELHLQYPAKCEPRVSTLHHGERCSCFTDYSTLIFRKPCKVNAEFAVTSRSPQDCSWLLSSRQHLKASSKHGGSAVCAPQAKHILIRRRLRPCNLSAQYSAYSRSRLTWLGL